MLRAIPLLSVLALLLSSPSQAALVFAAPASLPPAPPENASAAFLNDGSESRIGLLCHNDPVNKSDPTGENPLVVGLIVAYLLLNNPNIANAPAPGDSTPASHGMAGMLVDSGILAVGAGGAAVVSKVLTNITVKTETVLVQRAMSQAELSATQSSSLLRGGREGAHYVSDAVNSTAGRAQQRLSLAQRPEVRATLRVPADRLSAPSRVAPNHNMPGGGMERTASGQVPVKVERVDKY